MPHFKNLALSLLLLLLSLAICHAKEVYIEMPTPSGVVAPQSPQSIDAPRPYRNPTANQSTTFSRVNDSASAYNEVGSTLAKPLMSEYIINEFMSAYKAQKSPRMLIFLNRSLSDEVREWKTENRTLATGKGEHYTVDGEIRSSYRGPYERSNYTQKHIEESLRLAPADEGWMWSFEDGFINAFLDAGAAIVDRTTIMRIAAADSGQQGDAYNLMAVKKIEMDAMRGRAELFFEILIRKSLRSKLGYEFKVSAKEVNTGLIKGHVSTKNWDYVTEDHHTEKVVATDRGYESVTETVSTEMPEVDVISRDLALALMESLTANWSR